MATDPISQAFYYTAAESADDIVWNATHRAHTLAARETGPASGFVNLAVTEMFRRKPDNFNAATPRWYEALKYVSDTIAADVLARQRATHPSGPLTPQQFEDAQIAAARAVMNYTIPESVITSALQYALSTNGQTPQLLAAMQTAQQAAQQATMQTQAAEQAAIQAFAPQQAEREAQQLAAQHAVQQEAAARAAADAAAAQQTAAQQAAQRAAAELAAAQQAATAAAAQQAAAQTIAQQQAAEHAMAKAAGQLAIAQQKAQIAADDLEAARADAEIAAEDLESARQQVQTTTASSDGEGELFGIPIKGLLIAAVAVVVLIAVAGDKN